MIISLSGVICNPVQKEGRVQMFHQRRPKPLRVKSGDVVRLDFSGAATRKGAFNVRVLELLQNSIGSHLIRYERLDGEKQDFDLCNISFVKAVLVPAPYIIRDQPRINAFAGHGYFIDRPRRGYKRGDFESLVCHALASVGNVNLPHQLHETRPIELYKKACEPGRVQPIGSAPWYIRHAITVHWKTFRRWAYQNASRLILTQSEARTAQLAHKKRMDDDLHDAIEADMKADMDREFDDLYGDTSRGDMDREIASWI